MVYVSPSLPIAPLIINWTPNIAPTSAAHSWLEHSAPVIPCSSSTSDMTPRSTSCTRSVLLIAVVNRSVRVCASITDIPRPSKSNTATVGLSVSPPRCNRNRCGACKPTISQAKICISVNKPAISPSCVELTVRSAAPVSTENIFTSIVYLSPNFPIVPLIINWTPNSCPTSAAHSSDTQPDWARPCSAIILSIAFRSIKRMAFVDPISERMRSVSVCTSCALMPCPSKSNMATVGRVSWADKPTKNNRMMVKYFI